MNLPPKDPHGLHLDLSEVEGNPIAHLLVEKTDPSRTKVGLGYPVGLAISADVGAHGADVHLNWGEVRNLPDTLTRLLREAGED
jgi:hypothetical protein